jgi:alkanesulfonate monooxygenase SsuD/methylene tetrahydromethanopterin reductase-like flavin-dependent oxidoreductase (luciferase family)
MRFGLFCQSTRRNSSPQQSWEENLQDIIDADELGFEETWVAEHIGGGGGQTVIPVVDLFICKAAALTKQMRFGPGIRNLQFYQPVEVALQASVCDTLTNGRYMAGFGAARAPGEKNHMKEFGIDRDLSDERDMVLEAIELILKCWTETEPFDFQGKFYHGEGILLHPRPIQKPHPPVGMANSGTVATAEYIGQQGFFPLYYFFDTAPQLDELATAYVEAGLAAGRSVSRNETRLSRVVYVAETDQQALDDVRGDIEPTLDARRAGARLRHLVRSLAPGDSLDDLNFDYLVKNGIFLVGSPDTVYQRIKEFYDEMGGFGVLLTLIGHQIGTLEQRKRSRKLFMDEVAPRLRELTPDPNQLVAATT